MTSTNKLYKRSIEIIKKYQDKSGAYIASPNFEQYQYCWLRDGSFIAHAMDCVGEYQSSRAYFEWVDNVLKRHKDKVLDLEARISNGGSPLGNEFLHTRYLLNGKEDPEDNGWGNFQIDGYGTWLWALAEHINITQDLSFLNKVTDSISLTWRYLNAVYLLPCYDLWEENPGFLHTYSLSAVHGGIKAISNLVKKHSIDIDSDRLDNLLNDIYTRIIAHGVIKTYLVKHLKHDNLQQDKNSIDASLIAVCTPYQVLSAKSDLFKNTLNLIEQELFNEGGGVYRFMADTFYGGGEWVLLTGWLGWHYARLGKLDAALYCQQWIENQADDQFQLPEQVSDKLLFPGKYQKWKDNWGEIAKPLLWSHAMYLILVSEIQKNQGKL